MGLKDSIKNLFGSTKDHSSQSFATARSYRELFDNKYGEIKCPYRKNIWVYAAVKAIADNIGQVQFVVDEVKKDGSSTRIAINSPLSTVIDQVNPHMTHSELLRVITTDLLTKGMWFVAKESGTGNMIRPNEVPRELWPLNPSYVEAVVDKQTKLLVGWKYELPGSDPIIYPLHAVVYDRLYDPNHSWRGLSPVTPAWQNILGDQYASIHQSTLLKNKAVPEGILISEGKLTPDQAKQIMEKWEARLQGINRTGRVAILQGGMKYQDVSFSAKDLGLEAQQHWDRDAILAAYRVPKFMVGLYEDLNFATSKEARKTFWLETIIPITRQISDAFNNNLIKPIPSRVNLVGKFDLSMVPALQANLTELLAQATDLKALGYSTNDINNRLDLGMPEIVVVEPSPAKSISETSIQDDIRELIPLMSNKAVVEDVSSHHSDTLKGKLKNCLWKLRKGYLNDSSDIDALISKFSDNTEKSIDIVRKEVLEDVVSELKNQYPNHFKDIDSIEIDNLPSAISEVIKLVSEKISDDYTTEEIKSLFNSAGTMLSIIAKTELITFTNYARHELMLNAGFDSKTWVTSSDCKDHKQLDGDTVKMADTFSNGLKYPADIAGGNEIIGCSCSITGIKNEE